MGPRAQLAAAALGVSAAVTTPGGDVSGIPVRALQAYVAAAEGPDSCPGLTWQVIAGIYRQESGHATHGGATLNADGVAYPPIYGVPVDWLDGDRAQGPGQFMTSSWRLYGQGDPQDIDDAAAATARHLCGTFGDLEGPHLRGAIVSYYGADQDGYADSVLASVEAYDRVDEHLVPSATKERTPMRAWDSAVRGWVRLGDGLKRVGLGRAWTAADDAVFGAAPESRIANRDARTDGELDPVLKAAVDRMIAAAPAELTITSTVRDAEKQLALWNDSPAMGGSGYVAAWSDGVTCNSKHCIGDAIDIDGPGLAWAHEHAAEYGVHFPVADDPVHVELLS